MMGLSDSKPESIDLAALQRRFVDYELLDFISRGGQGYVLKGVQRSTRRLVAIKLIRSDSNFSPRHRTRFLREIEILAQLHHPNIVTLYESGTIDDEHFYSMEFIEGVPIDVYVVVERPGMRELLTLFERVLDGMSHAHQRGVIHRDLKPANILVDNAGNPHIVDFGLAKEAYWDAAAAFLHSESCVGEVVGTLPYLSPEQTLGSREVDTRSDIYSLGLVLYRLITDCFPYPIGSSAGEMRRIIQEVDIPSMIAAVSARGAPPRAFDWSIPTDLDRVVLKALEKDAGRRYQSVSEFQADLHRVITGEAVFARADSLMYLLRCAIRRYRIPATIAAAFLMLMLAFTVTSTWLWRRAEETARLAHAGLEMGAHLRVGSVERDEGRSDQAMEMYRKAIEIGQSIQNPDPLIQRFLYDAHHRTAMLLLKNPNRLDEAQQHCGQAVAIAAGMRRQRPADDEAIRTTAFSHVLQGQLHKVRRDWSGAIVEFEKAEQLYTQVMHHHPDNLRCRFDVAEAQRFRVHCLKWTGQLDTAIDLMAQASRTFNDLLQEQPASTEFSMESARSHAMMGELYLRRKDPETTMKAIDQLIAAKTAFERLKTDEAARSRRWEIRELLEDVGTNLEIARRRSEKFAESLRETGL